MLVDRLADAPRALNARRVAQQSRHRWLALCTAVATLPWAVTAAAVCYVDGAAVGVNSGASWVDAYTDLQSGLKDAGCTEVWVAQGVYKPVVPANLAAVTPAERAVSFKVAPGVAVYGGFAGDEASVLARDPTARLTILSGDIDNNDTGVGGVDSDASKIVGSNSLHVVLLDGTAAGNPITATTVLDGFTLTGGNNTNGEGGGALWCRGSGAGHACSPTLAGLVLSGNRAQNGGAMALDGYSGGACNPTLTRVIFSGNSASQFGGALYSNAQLSGGTCSPTLVNVAFSNNSSTLYGGAMFNDGTGTGTSSPTLTNVTFSDNTAGSQGGAIYNNGGGGVSSPTLTNVTFSGNKATGGNGGAMYNNGGVSSGTSSPKLINATFSGNSAVSGGAMCGQNAFGPLLIGSIVWGDSATASDPEFCVNIGSITLVHSIIQNGCAANHCSGDIENLSGDPTLGALADNGGFTRTMMPGPGSAAINALSCDYANETPPMDQRDAVRPDSASTGATRCDIGAVEVDSLPGDRIFASRFGAATWDDF